MTPPLAQVALGWTAIDTWIVLTGMACGVACALVGCFLLLRKLSMMGDAISHAVLPGLVLGFLLTGTRDPWPMLIGAVVVGVLTAYLTELVRSSGQVEEGASMGVVFTTLFALGLVLVVRYADRIDLDPSCVLFGLLETVPLDTVVVAGVELPRALAVLGGVLLLNAAVVVLLFKELKLSSFDPATATALGIPARAMHYLLMTLTALTTVASFEAVGSILVVAMLVVPAATALLLTRRLVTMLVVASVCGAMSAALGHVAAVVLPAVAQVPATSTTGMMAVCAGLLLVGALLLSPKEGLVVVAVRRWKLRLAEAEDDLLATMYRDEEAPDRAVRLDPLARRPLLKWWAGRSLRASGDTRPGVGGGADRLTEAGRDRARRLVRAHRLWETFLVGKVNVRPDHTHRTAERLEHVTDERLREKLAEAAPVPDPTSDPQGRQIPPER